MDLLSDLGKYHEICFHSELDEKRFSADLADPLSNWESFLKIQEG